MHILFLIGATIYLFALLVFNQSIRMSVKNLRFSQTLPISKAAAWNFFSDPKNLSKITPKEMNFVIHSDISNNKTYPGQIICYTVSPLFNIPLNWVTEITHVSEPDFFVDEQRKGPYKLWHHQHHFIEKENGVEMIDILHYEIPFGFVGNFLNHLFIEKKIKEIFSFRNKALNKIFGE